MGESADQRADYEEGDGEENRGFTADDVGDEGRGRLDGYGG